MLKAFCLAGELEYHLLLRVIQDSCPLRSSELIASGGLSP